MRSGRPCRHSPNRLGPVVLAERGNAHRLASSDREPSRFFAGVALGIAILGLDRGGLTVVDTRLWGGLLVTLVVSVTGIVASMPVGIALALGRRSTLPLSGYSQSLSSNYGAACR